jgi:hypothetical protein
MQVEDIGREAKERMRKRKTDEQRVKYEQGQVQQKRTEIALVSIVFHAQQKLKCMDLSTQRTQVRG